MNNAYFNNKKMNIERVALLFMYGIRHLYLFINNGRANRSADL